MKYLYLYTNKLDFQKQRVFLIKSLWKRKYKTKFIYLFSKKKNYTFFGKPLSLEDVQVNTFDKFGYPCAQNTYILRTLTGLPFFKLTAPYKCFNYAETLKHLDIISKYNFEYNIFKVKNSNFIHDIYFFNYFFNTSKPLIFKQNYNFTAKNQINLLKSKSLNNFVFSSYSNNILSSFKFWITRDSSHLNKSYLNLFYVKNDNRAGPIIANLNLYLRLKFFYLYLFKNLELKYIHILNIKLSKFKEYFKKNILFTAYSLNFFNLLLQNVALSAFYIKINFLVVKNSLDFYYNYKFRHLFFSFLFNLSLKKYKLSRFSLMFKKKSLSTSYRYNSCFIVLNKKIVIKSNLKLNKFLFSSIDKINNNKCYFSLLQFFEKYKIFLLRSFLTLSNTLSGKIFLLNSVKSNTKSKNFNLYLFARYFLHKKSSILTKTNNNLCHKFFKNLFFKYNRKFLKKFWKYSLGRPSPKLLNSINKGTGASNFSILFNTNTLRYNVTTFGNLFSFNFLSLELKTKKLKFKKIMALSFFFSFLLNRNHWYYYYNLFMPNIKLNILTTHNENITANIKLLTWFKKNNNNNIYKQSLYLFFFKNKNVYSFFYQYLFYKQLGGIKNYNILNFFYINNLNFFFNTYNYFYFDNFFDIEMCNLKYFENTNFSDIKIQESRLVYFKQIFNFNLLNNSVSQQTFNYKYIYDFFFFNSNVFLNFFNKKFLILLNVLSFEKISNNIFNSYFFNIISIKFYIYYFNIFFVLFKKIASLIFIYSNYFFSFSLVKKMVNALDIKKKKVFLDISVIIYFQYISLLKFLIKLVKIYIVIFK